MNLSKLIKLLLIMPPLFALGCMGPSRRARKKAAATHLWTEQEKMINDQLGAEENKMNSQFRESKYNQKITHVLGVPKVSSKDKRVGLYGQMDLIRE